MDLGEAQRDALLTLAEAIVNERGPQALTIDALAKAAGISKGGVQYSFSSKDQLISALLDRWDREFDELLADIDVACPTGFIRSYMLRCAAHTALLTQNPSA